MVTITGDVVVSSVLAREAAAGTTTFGVGTGITRHRLPGLERGMKRGAGNVWREILTLFSSARVRRTFEQPLEIPVAEVHCPHVTGAEAKATFGESMKRTMSTFVLFGVGGGVEHEFEVSENCSITVPSGQCVQLVYGFPATWEECEYNDRHGQWQQFVRLRTIETGTTIWRAHDLAANDLCNSDDPLAERQLIDLLEIQGGKVTRSLKTAARTSWSGKVKLSVPGGIEAGGEFKATRGAETSWEYTLPAGRSYVALRTSRAPGWAWPSAHSS